MNTPEQDSAFNKHTSDEINTQEVSFKKTYESIETLFGSKIAKLIASKNLIVAEAKLSLSAILLSFAISLTLVVIAGLIWLLINVGIGLVLHELIHSIGVPIFILLALNSLLGLWLFKQLKNIWKLVGFHSTVSNIVKGE